MRYVIIEHGTVGNIAIADEPQGANWVQHATAGIGWTQGVNGELVAPPEPASPAPEPRHISQLAFLTRFTDAEAIGIDLASMGATVQAAGMRRYLNKVNAAEYIDLDRADTRAGVQALEAAGALAVGRALTILDAAVQPGERYRGR